MLITFLILRIIKIDIFNIKDWYIIIWNFGNMLEIKNLLICKELRQNEI